MKDLLTHKLMKDKDMGFINSKTYFSNTREIFKMEKDMAKVFQLKKGKLLMKDGATYEGNFLDDEITGKGCMKYV